MANLLEKLKGKIFQFSTSLITHQPNIMQSPSVKDRIYNNNVRND